jgi:hypothetical protein
MKIQIIQNYIGIALTIAMIGFTISTGVMYIAVKMKGYTPVGVHIKSKWSINLDIKFFSDLRKGYVAMGNSRLIPITNQLCICTLICGWLLMIVSIFAEFY